MIDFVLNFNRETADSIEWPSTLSFQKIIICVDFLIVPLQSNARGVKMKKQERTENPFHTRWERVCVVPYFFRERIETRMRSVASSSDRGTHL